jgi:hypothetical protein
MHSGTCHHSFNLFLKASLLLAQSHHHGQFQAPIYSDCKPVQPLLQSQQSHQILPLFLSLIYHVFISLFPIHSFHVHISTFPLKLLSYTVDKNYMFLLCNGLLVFIVKNSGLVGKSPLGDDLTEEHVMKRWYTLS